MAYANCAYKLMCLEVECGLWNEAHWLIICVRKYSSCTYYICYSATNQQLVIHIVLWFRASVHDGTASDLDWHSALDRIWVEQCYPRLYGDAMKIDMWDNHCIKHALKGNYIRLRVNSFLGKESYICCLFLYMHLCACMWVHVGMRVLASVAGRGQFRMSFLRRHPCCLYGQGLS